MSTGENTILQGKIFEPLIKFAIPLMLTILLQALYGAVDLIVVGKFGSTSSVSAVSNGSQIMQTVIQLITGLTMGVTVLVGRYVGSKDSDKAAETVGGMIKLFSYVAVIITLAMIVFAEKIAIVMQIPAEAFDKTVLFLRVCAIGTIFIVAYNAISGLFRGLGNSKSPLTFIAVACSVNIVANLFFVGLLKLDVLGTALATVLAQASSVIFSLIKIKKNGLPFKVTKDHLRNTKTSVLNILKIGSPVALQDFLVSLSFLIIMAIINDISLVASASIGIAEKLFVFLALVPISFMYALAAFVAQNVGAKQEPRAIKALGVAALISFSFGVVMFLLTYFAGDTLAGFFEDDKVVIASTQSYLRGVSFEYMVVPFVFCFLGYFNGIGKTTFVLIEGLVSSFAVRIPLCYYFSRLPNADLFTIGLTVPISSVASMAMCIVYYIFIRKKRLAMN